MLDFLPAKHIQSWARKDWTAAVRSGTTTFYIAVRRKLNSPRESASKVQVPHVGKAMAPAVSSPEFSKREASVASLQYSETDQQRPADAKLVCKNGERMQNSSNRRARSGKLMAFARSG